jgi:hypothetical protein
MTRLSSVIGAVLVITCASWLLPAPAAADLILITPTDDDRGADTMPIDNNFGCCFFDPGGATVSLSPFDQEAGGLEFDISALPDGALITSVTLTLFMMNTFGAETAVLHGFAGNGTVEGADLGVSNLLLGFTVPAAGLQFQQDLDVPTAFLQGLVDAGELFAGFTLRNETPGGGSFTFFTIDSPTSALHPVLAVEFQAAVPEPASLMLVGAGLTGLCLRLRRRSRRT